MATYQNVATTSSVIGPNHCWQSGRLGTGTLEIAGNGDAYIIGQAGGYGWSGVEWTYGSQMPVEVFRLDRGQ